MCVCFAEEMTVCCFLDPTQRISQSIIRLCVVACCLEGGGKGRSDKGQSEGRGGVRRRKNKDAEGAEEQNG